MLKGKHKSILVLAMMLALVGQSLAAVGSACPMHGGAMASAGMAGMAMDQAMNRAADQQGPCHGQVAGVMPEHQAMLHPAGDWESGARSVDQCCIGGVCLKAHCFSTVPGLVASFAPFSTAIASAVESPYTVSYLAPETVSPFRPPISR